MFNEIDGDFDDVAIKTFKIGLPTEHDLRKSLTKKLVRSVCRLVQAGRGRLIAGQGEG